MSIDEQLRRAFDTLSDHLRDELNQQAAALTNELAATAGAERDQAVADATAERDRALAAVRAEYDQALMAAGQQHEEALAAAIVEAARAARDEAESEAAARLANATAVAEARGREQAEAAARRVAELEAELREAAQRARAAQDESREALERAAAAARADARSGEAAALDRLLDGIRAIDRARSLSEILDTLVGCAAREARRAGVLLARGGRLRTWRFIGFDDRFDQQQPFDVQYGDAGILAEAVRLAQPCAGDGTTAPRFAQPGGNAAVAVPLILAGQVIAVLYADSADPSDAGRMTEPIELLARHAASALEAVTAFKTARALVENQPPPSSDNGDEAARRYARLLVSEIKLYHEADVLAGRRERNLATRLAVEIARARALYEERVPLAVRAANDYFHAELVRTLASGDPSLLGDVKA